MTIESDLDEHINVFFFFLSTPLSSNLNYGGRSVNRILKSVGGWIGVGSCPFHPQWKYCPCVKVKTKVDAPKMSVGIILCTVALCEPQLLVHLSTLGQTRLNQNAVLLG